jgi:DNA-binding NtrC family response regulator
MKEEPMLSGVVLVIDDQEAILTVAEDMLGAYGMQALLASNGLQGIALFEAHHETIDVVLLDLKMPGMSGDKVFTKMKQIDPAVRVIITSGFSERETLDYFANDQDVVFLQKPYRFQSLIETVTAVLNRPK